jgi:hypothetical protein
MNYSTLKRLRIAVRCLVSMLPARHRIHSQKFHFSVNQQVRLCHNKMRQQWWVVPRSIDSRLEPRLAEQHCNNWIHPSAGQRIF